MPCSLRVTRHGLRVDSLCQRRCRNDDFVVIFRRSVRHLGKFLPVRRDQRGAAIDAVVAAFWIDDDRLAERVRRIDRRAHDAFGQRALGIVGEHDGAGLRRGLLDMRDQRVLGRLIDRRRGFPIGTQEMRRMMLGDEAHLARGLPLRVGHQMKFDPRLGGERLGQGNAGIVVADHADENTARAERDQIARHVAGAADHHFAALDGDDHGRRLGRHARDLAIDEFVQHQIADAEHGLVGERGQLLVEIEHGLVIAVGRVEIAVDVACHRVLERCEAGVIASEAQVFDARLREILILPADRIRHLDIFDIGRAPKCLEHGDDHVAEAFRPCRCRR